MAALARKLSKPNLYDKPPMSPTEKYLVAERKDVFLLSTKYLKSLSKLRLNSVNKSIS